MLLNGRPMCALEHTILVRRNGEWGLLAGYVAVGGAILQGGFGEEIVAIVEQKWVEFLEQRHDHTLDPHERSEQRRGRELQQREQQQRGSLL